MRAISPSMQSELARGGQDALWVLTITWPDGEEHYAQRDALLADTRISGSLVESGNLEHREGSIRRPLHSDRLRASLALDGPERPTIRERLARADLEGLAVVWRLALLDTEGQGSLADTVILFRGVIERVVEMPDRVELACADLLTSLGRRRFGRLVSRNELPEAGSPIEGSMLPWVFGSIDRVELLPWKSGTPLRLRADVAPGDGVIPLQSISGLPRSGVVQIGDERIEYDTIDEAAMTLGRGSMPVRRPERARHGAGASARLVPRDGFEWLVAGHPCLAVDDVQADGLSLEDGEWSGRQESWRGEMLQKVAMERWPAWISHASTLSTLRFNGVACPEAWALNGDSTAADGVKAFDEAGPETWAEIHAGARLLSLAWRGALAKGRKEYGILAGVRIRVRIAADLLWEPTTTVTLSVRKGTIERSIRLARPRPEVLALTVPKHVHPPGSDPSEPLTLMLRYGPSDFILDFGDLALANGDWEFLHGAEEEALEIRIERNTGGDPVRFLVSDVEIQVDFRARTSEQMARAITARVDGVADDGTLLENPADLIRFFLCHPGGLGIAPESLDSVSFAQAADALEDRKYRFSNRLRLQSPLRAILSRLLLESRTMLRYSGDRFSLVLDPADPVLASADFEFDAAGVLDCRPIRRVRDMNGQLLRSVSLHYGCDFSGESGAGWRRWLLSDSIEYLFDGVGLGQTHTERLQWHNRGNAEAVADLARALLGRRGFRTEQIAFHAPLAAAGLEPGDRISLSIPTLGLMLDQGRVDALEVDEPHRLLLRARFAVVGADCWRHDPGTFLRLRCSDRMLEIWIAGRLVGFIAGNGNLRIRGAARERHLVAQPVAAPVIWDQSNHLLVFGSGDESGHVAQFALNPDGDLLVAGSIGERIERQDVIRPGTEYLASDSSRFALWLTDMTPVLVADAATGELHLRGALTEYARFYNNA